MIAEHLADVDGGSCVQLPSTAIASALRDIFAFPYRSGVVANHIREHVRRGAAT